MQKLEPLKIGASGHEYVFTENPQLVEYLQGLYPKMKFEVTLSLTPFPQVRNLHQIPVTAVLTEGLTYDSIQMQDMVLDSLLNFLDSVQEQMHRQGIQTSTVHLSRITLGTTVDSIALKNTVYAHLRACFLPN